MSWPKVRLGDVLIRSEESTFLQADLEYSEITVKLWGKGVILRGRVTGAAVAGSRRFCARAGQFILSRIDARNGAIGIVPSGLDGAVVTNDFPLFNLDLQRIDPNYLGWLGRTSGFVELCRRASEGTTNRVRLQEDRFLRLEISLPPLAEQRRVLAQIERMVAQIDEARSLRLQAIEEGEILCRSILSHDPQSRLTPMRDLVRLRPPDVAVRREDTYQFAGVYCFGRGVFRGNKKSGMDFAYPRLTRLRTGDFVYPKLMAWEGALGVVPPECDQCVVSTEFPVFEIRQDLVHPEVLDVFFRNPAVWPELAGASIGTNVRRRRLNPENFLNFRIPLPTRETQERLRKVRAQLHAMGQIQEETALELDALLPAILDRAYSGLL